MPSFLFSFFLSYFFLLTIPISLMSAALCEAVYFSLKANFGIVYYFLDSRLFYLFKICWLMCL